MKQALTSTQPGYPARNGFFHLRNWWAASLGPCCFWVVALLAPIGGAHAQETVGGGTDASPALGPAASYNLAKDFTLVKNWHWGQNGTIRNMADMTSEFNYHDQFGQFNNGGGLYGSSIIAADAASAIWGQRVEDPQHPVRQILDESLRTYLVPLDGATRIKPDWHNVGDGGFTAKWQLPMGGDKLGRDIVWETRMRYVVPQQYWWALWVCANSWTGGKGPEIDLVEGFGFDNGCGASCTNFDGRYWHSNSIGGADEIDYGNWPNGMATAGIPYYDPTQYHTWTLVYRQDNSYAMYCDGIQVQGGKSYLWTEAQNPAGKACNMTFLFDAAWGHTQIASVDKELDASILQDKYYEFEYSRVYLGPTSIGDPSLPVQLTEFTARAQSLGTVRVAWHTATELNSARFEVERSTASTGGGFAAIATVVAQGTKTTPTDYSLLDEQLPAGTGPLYYRLRQVDQDGRATYSPVRVVARAAVAGDIPLGVYPNPACGTVSVRQVPAGGTVVVLDALGREVTRASADAAGTAELALPVGLGPGLYVVRSGSQTTRLVVK